MQKSGKRKEQTGRLRHDAQHKSDKNHQQIFINATKRNIHFALSLFFGAIYILFVAKNPFDLALKVYCKNSNLYKKGYCVPSLAFRFVIVSLINPNSQYGTG